MIAALDALPADGRTFLSDVSLLEVAILVGQKRLILPIPFEEWVEAAAISYGFEVCRYHPYRGRRRQAGGDVPRSGRQGHRCDRRDAKCALLTRDKAISGRGWSNAGRRHHKTYQEDR